MFTSPKGDHNKLFYTLYIIRYYFSKYKMAGKRSGTEETAAFTTDPEEILDLANLKEVSTSTVHGVVTTLSPETSLFLLF